MPEHNADWFTVIETRLGRKMLPHEAAYAARMFGDIRTTISAEVVSAAMLRRGRTMSQGVFADGETIRTETRLSPIANDLYLTILSDGDSYLRRLETARKQKMDPTSPGTQAGCAVYWAELSGRFARHNHFAFADKGSPAPTVAEILEAATALAAYHQEHLAEF